nr:ShlB/FhaC/HecB family hemolysin secretion/activation protein [uncultured Albidiferax sp.]
MNKTFAFATLFLGTIPPLWAQTTAVPPPNAGTLLEQQRRLSPPALPQPPGPGVLPAAPVPPGTDTGASRLTTVLRFQVDGSTLVESAAIQNVLSPWLNRPVSLADLRQATAAVEDLYRQCGWLARVSLPGQDITDGTVRFAVTESRLGRIVLQPGDTPLGPVLTARVQALLEYHLPAGQPLRLPALERALLLANDIPGVRVNGSLQASDTPGSTDVVVGLRPSAPYRVEASLDNGGNRATGSARATAQLSLLSPLGQGEQFNLGGSVSRGSQYLSLGGYLPVGPQGWRIVGAASVLRYQVLDARNTTTGLPPEGGSTSFGASAQYPLVRTALAHWLFSAGWVQTRLHNRDDNQTLGILDTASRARSRALQLGLIGNQFDRLGGGGANSASLVLTHGRLSLDGSPIQFADASTVAAQGGFSKLRWSASRLQTLTPSLSLLGSATGQFASANLDPSEKLYLGGMNGVRAYPNAEGGGSTGTQLSLDLRQELSAQWQASAFYDWGQVQQYKHNRYASSSATPLVAHNRVTLQGAGLALTWRGPHGTQIQGTWAHRIGSNPLATPSGTDTDGSLHKNRFWLHASIAF